MAEKKTVRGFPIEEESKVSSGPEGSLYRATKENKKYLVRVFPVHENEQKVVQMRREYLFLKESKQPCIADTAEAFYTKNNHYFITEICEGKSINDHISQRRSKAPSIERLIEEAQMLIDLITAYQKIQTLKIPLYLMRNLDLNHILITPDTRTITMIDQGQGSFTSGKTIERSFGEILHNVIFLNERKNPPKSFLEEAAVLKKLHAFCNEESVEREAWETLFDSLKNWLAQELLSLSFKKKDSPSQAIREFLSRKPSTYTEFLAMEKIEDREVLDWTMKLIDYFQYRRDAAFIFNDLIAEIASLCPKSVSEEHFSKVACALLLRLKDEITKTLSICENDKPLEDVYKNWKQVRRYQQMRIPRKDLEEWLEVINKTIKKMREYVKDEETEAETLTDAVIDKFTGSLLNDFKLSLNMHHITDENRKKGYILWLMYYLRNFEAEFLGAGLDFFQGAFVNLQLFKARFNKSLKICLDNVLQFYNSS